MLVGSRIQLFKIAKNQNSKHSFQIVELGRINEVIRSQPLLHSCQIISTATPFKIKFNFLILDRISKELTQVDLNFRKGTLYQRTLLQRLMGSATPLSRDKKSFQAVLLDSRKDTIISFDVKRHAVTHQLHLVKSKSIRINTCYFQIYKLFKMSHRLLMLIQHTRSLVVNLDNLCFNEDTSLSFNEHDQSQRETITSRIDDMHQPSHHMVCFYDQRRAQSDLTLWKVSSHFCTQTKPPCSEKAGEIASCHQNFQVNKESEQSFKECFMSD